MLERSEIVVGGRTIGLLLRRVGTKFVFTSPDVPELHVSHADLEEARASLPSAVEGIARLKAHLAARLADRQRLLETA